jgi:hypothetical protein
MIEAVKVAFRDEDNLYLSQDAPGAYINLEASTFVLIRTLSKDELQQEFVRFYQRLCCAFKSLLSMSASEVGRIYGQLDMRRPLDAEPDDLEYGFVSTGGGKWRLKFTSLRESAVVQALVETGCVKATTPTGKIRTRIRDGGAVSTVLALNPSLRKEVIEVAFELHEDLDDLLRTSQTGRIGIIELWELIQGSQGSTGANDALLKIAEATHDFYTEQKTQGSETTAAAGSGRTFAPAWFAQHLAAVGVWVVPARYVDDVINIYPIKWRPVGAWMAVPDNLRPFAERVLSLHRAARGRSSRILPVFLSLAQSSNAWQNEEVRAAPLIFFKRQMQLEKSGAGHDSAAVNQLYRAFCTYLSVPLNKSWDAVHLMRGTRLANKGIQPFDWCEHPNAKNLARPSKLLGYEVLEIPASVQLWADYLRSLLPIYGVKNPELVVRSLDLWLIYLLSLRGGDTPHDFSSVVRRTHVNALAAHNDGTLVSFLKGLSGKVAESTLYRVVPALQKAWSFAAIRDGFADRLTNPFDPKQDKVVDTPKRLPRTSRHSLDEEVWRVIVEENRNDGFAFARRYGGELQSSWYSVLDPVTGQYIQVFLPITATLIDAILHSGMRKRSARWLDSGEFDERIADPRSKVYHANPNPLAIAGRNEGFLQLIQLPGERNLTLSMFVNTNKTSDGFDVPWMDENLALHVDDLRELQGKYNPLRGLVLALDPSPLNQYVPSDLAAEVAPLFRDPSNDLGIPVSDAKVSLYWEALLEHCQAVVDQRLGYHYPLFDADGSLRFDIHSLRVTTVTLLLQAGVSPEIVRTLLNHLAVAMTHYYRDVSPSEVYKALRSAMDEIRGALNTSGDEADEIIEAMVRDAVTLRDVNDFAGADLLRQHRTTRSAPILTWTHGICPGGDCETGGERIAEGRYAAVWRPAACSKCRYRLTRPKFYFGLVERANGLMMEIVFSARKERELNLAADEAEDQGMQSANLRALAQKEREMREKLWEEYIAERKTIHVCEKRIMEGDHTAFSEFLPMRPDFAEDVFRTRLEEVHPLKLAHDLVKQTRFLPEAIQGVPSGTEEFRDAMLHRILAANDMGELLYRVDPKIARRLKDLSMDEILDAVGEPSLLQQLIDATVLIDDIPRLSGLRDALRTVGRLASADPSTTGKLA